jgi:hypothetical protein
MYASVLTSLDVFMFSTKWSLSRMGRRLGPPRSLYTWPPRPAKGFLRTVTVVRDKSLCTLLLRWDA